MKPRLVSLLVLGVSLLAGPAAAGYAVPWEYMYVLKESAGYAIDLAPDGSLLVGGVAYEGDFGASASKPIVIRLSTYGAEMWSVTIFGTSGDPDRENAAHSVRAHPGGAILVGGQLNTGGGAMMDGWAALLGTWGTLYWSKTYNGALSSTDSIESVAVNYRTGEVYAAGRQTRCAGNSQLWVMMLDLGTGTKMCDYIRVPDMFCRASSAKEMAVDAATGDVYVTGNVMTGVQWWDGWIGKFGGKCPLTLDWSRTLDGALSSTDYASGVALDAGGNPVVVGSQAVDGSYLDAWIVSLSSTNGAIAWSLTLDGGEGDDDEALACEVDSSGTIFVAGYVDRLTTGSFTDVWASGVSASGSALWETDRDFPGKDLDRAEGIAVEDSAHFYVVGTIMDRFGKKRLYVGAFEEQNQSGVTTDPDLGYPYATPNPYRPGSGGGQDASGITFRGLEPGSRVRIYSLAGAQVAELEDTDRDGRELLSPVANDSGTELASGIYIFVVIPEDGEVTRGKVVIIR